MQAATTKAGLCVLLALRNLHTELAEVLLTAWEDDAIQVLPVSPSAFTMQVEKSFWALPGQLHLSTGW